MIKNKTKGGRKMSKKELAYQAVKACCYEDGDTKRATRLLIEHGLNMKKWREYAEIGIEAREKEELKI